MATDENNLPTVVQVGAGFSLSENTQGITNSVVYGKADSANLRAGQNYGQPQPTSEYVFLGNSGENKGFQANIPASGAGMTLNPSDIEPVKAVQTTSGYIATSTFASPQQQFLISNSPAQATKDVKLVYAVPFSMVPTSHMNTAPYARTNMELVNGNSSVSIASAGMATDNLVKNGLSVLRQNISANPVCNVTSPMPQMVNVYRGAIPSPHQIINVVQPSTILNSTASMQGANSHLQTTVAKSSAIPPKQLTQNSHNFMQVGNASSWPAQIAFNASGNVRPVISVPKYNAPTGSPIRVVTPVMTNQRPVSSVQLLKVNPACFVSSNIQGVLTPPAVTSNLVRNSGPPKVIRLQTIHPRVGPNGSRNLLPQHVFVPTSEAAVKSIEQNTQNQSPYIISKNFLPQNGTREPSVQSGDNRNFGYSGHKNNNSPYGMCSETEKEKCYNFLSSLVTMPATNPTFPSVIKKMVQGLIDGTISAENFTSSLQKLFSASSRPILIVFLKKCLPFLRHSLFTKELTIEGINPPPSHAPMLQIPEPPLNKNGHFRTTILQPAAMSSAAGSVLTAQQSQPANANAIKQIVDTPRISSSRINYNTQRIQVPLSVLQNPSTGLSPLVWDQQPKPSILRGSDKNSVASICQKKKVVPTVQDAKDRNDIVAMCGINLMEESQNILATNSELVGLQARFCKDDNYLLTDSFHAKVASIAAKAGVQELGGNIVSLVAYAVLDKLKCLIEKASLVAKHRVEVLKSNSRYQVDQDVKSQIRFLKELDQLKEKRHKEEELEIMRKLAKSRAKLEDPEQLELKQKAKEMQKAEVEEKRLQETNMTALSALGPRKKIKAESAVAGSINGGSYSNSNILMSKPRVKRVSLRDLHFVMEGERGSIFKSDLYEAYFK